MIVLAANISTLFREVPFLDRIQQAKDAGFGAVEAQFPYAVSASELARALRDAHLTLALINAPAGDLDAGERGLALGDRMRFSDSIAQALDYARETGCRRVHVLVGKPTGPLPDFVPGLLRDAAGEFDAQSIDLLLEALNEHDQPGYALPTLHEADALRRKVNAPNVRLLFDAYHVEKSGADVIRGLQTHASAVGHVQVSGVPDRQEPDPERTRKLFAVLRSCGYQGFVGCEYNPRHGTAAGLGWAREFGVVPRPQQSRG